MDSQTIANLNTSIINTFKAAFNDFEVYDYDDGAKLTVKSILIALNDFERPENPIPDFFTISCNFSAYICIPFSSGAKLEARQKALEVASFVDGNRWENESIFKKAKFLSAQPDTFNKKIDDAEVWQVQWTNDVKYRKDN